MRLICPSCGAQYEVDADLIPAAGRDVQCSACGHVWFEGPGGSAESEAAGESENVAGPEVEAEVEAPPTFADEPPPVAPMRSPRRTVTPAIAEILREEAERERAARAAEAQAALERQEELPLSGPEKAAVAADASPEPTPEPETPPELKEQSDVLRGTGMAADGPPASQPVAEAGEDGLAAAIRSAVVADAARGVATAVPDPALAVPAAAIRPAEPPASPAVAAAPVARRDRLPDIEEINSTLRTAGERSQAASGRAAGASSEGAGTGRGFRFGFSLVLLVAAALALVYVYAPRIIAAAPVTEPVIAPYAAAVDGGRLWLDLRLQDLVKALGTESGAES